MPQKLEIEAYRRENNDSERRKNSDVVMRTYQITGKFIQQCKCLARCKDTESFL